jgi:hypothetical protein
VYEYISLTVNNPAGYSTFSNRKSIRSQYPWRRFWCSVPGTACVESQGLVQGRSTDVLAGSLNTFRQPSPRFLTASEASFRRARVVCSAISKGTPPPPILLPWRNVTTHAGPGPNPSRPPTDTISPTKSRQENRRLQTPTEPCTIL